MNVRGRRSWKLWASSCCVAAISGCALGGVDVPASGDGRPASAQRGVLDAGIVADAAAATPDASVAPSESVDATVQGDDSGRDAATPLPDAGGALAACTRVVINEVQTAGATASDEFVELFHPGATRCSLDGWTLVYRSASGTSDVVLTTFASVIVDPNTYVVLAGSGYAGANQGALSGGLAAAGGQLQLRSRGGVVVSSMGYGSASGAFVRGDAASAPAVGESAARVPNGADTSDNATDFVVGTPTPGAANR
jgi:hypothetical protein